jgi:hypothetical protein
MRRPSAGFGGVLQALTTSGKIREQDCNESGPNRGFVFIRTSFTTTYGVPMAFRRKTAPPERGRAHCELAACLTRGLAFAYIAAS